MGSASRQNADEEKTFDEVEALGWTTSNATAIDEFLSTQQPGSRRAAPGADSLLGVSPIRSKRKPPGARAFGFKRSGPRQKTPHPPAAIEEAVTEAYTPDARFKRSAAGKFFDPSGNPVERA